MSTDTVQPRPPYKTPSHNDGGQNLPTHGQHKVNLRHPGYEGNNILITLPALDHPEGGIHHETARVACAIVADNRWDGYLSETERREEISMPPDGVLRKPEYYFHVPDNVDYPVVPSFADWCFPHRNLPEKWASYAFPSNTRIYATSTADPARARDISCRITNHVEGTQNAHMVPKAELQWHDWNFMSQYGVQGAVGAASVDDIGNYILLRNDVHHIFDSKCFAIVPKASTLLVHLTALRRNDELMQLYHNVTLQPLVGIPIEYIFARFAWTVLPLTRAFTTGGPKRWLRIRAADGWKLVEYTGTKCAELPGLTRSRSRSPRKRPNPSVPSSEDGPGGQGGEVFVRGRDRRPKPITSWLEDMCYQQALPTSGEAIATADVDDDGDYGQIDYDFHEVDDAEERESKGQFPTSITIRT